jgi:hypothetical protein
MDTHSPSNVVQLSRFNVEKGKSSVSGLSSGAFMTVQLHIAHSASFIGAGVIAGGPYRSAESFPGSAPDARDAYLLNSLYICMNPLTPQMAPNADTLAALARATAAANEIDPLSNLANDRVYIFTGSADRVVYSDVVAQTRAFYEKIGVHAANIAYVDTVPAGHSIVTDNLEDSLLNTNQPPYINNGGFMLSHRILNHLYDGLKPPAEQLSGRMLCFDQTEFFGNEPRASMAQYGYAYVPRAVLEGALARVHIAVHGCMQGYSYRPYFAGQPDVAGYAPYGNRYFTTTGYNTLADSNNIIVLYPQAQASEGGVMFNPEGCWDFWGYSCERDRKLDYYSRSAIQIKAIHGMLSRLGG